MDNSSNLYTSGRNVGIPYQNIKWNNIEGQPFGTAGRFNAIIFGDANNIIDVSGAMAVGGNFYSPRGMSIAFGNNAKLEGTGYSPNDVRLLVGGDLTMRRPLVVVGHVVGGGNFRVASGSTYLIGKSSSSDQLGELEQLYQAEGGSQYWKPTDKGDHYLISSFDVSRYIPASRIKADLSQFFADAQKSITDYKTCIEALPVNGTVTDNIHEWVLKGNDPVQNVFLIEAPGGILAKGIRAEVPEGSLVIVRLRTGSNAHMQYGVWGEKQRVYNTLYVFEDAVNIYMEKSADIWGSILAPQAMFHAHPTGGHVSGNVAFRSFAVNAESGFEFHLYPFKGGVVCQAQQPEAVEPEPTPEVQPAPAPKPVPIPKPVPTPEPSPAPEACPEQEPCPEPRSCPECPPQKPCPVPEPCPVCPPPQPCPACPPPQPCPECPVCPKPELPPTPECVITPGIISGFICGCSCRRSHKWEVCLYQIARDNNILLYREVINEYGCFRFKVPCKGHYLLCVSPLCQGRRSLRCRPNISLRNIGVTKLVIN